MKMKYKQLREVLQGLEGLGTYEKLRLAVEIARNIKRIKAIVEEADELARTIFMKFADKDGDGKVIWYEEKDSLGNDVRRNKISDLERKKLHQEEVDKLDEEEHDIELVRIPLSKIEGKEINANFLAPLLDIVITDREQKEKEQ
jgi:hypothetical protein